MRPREPVKRRLDPLKEHVVNLPDKVERHKIVLALPNFKPARHLAQPPFPDGPIQVRVGINGVPLDVSVELEGPAFAGSTGVTPRIAGLIGKQDVLNRCAVRSAKSDKPTQHITQEGILRFGTHVRQGSGQ
jgi:hypothetical protein